MYMVGGGSRVHRSQNTYPGATRWMTPSAPKREVSWHDVVETVMKYLTGVAFLAAVVIWTQILAVWLG